MSADGSLQHAEQLTVQNKNEVEDTNLESFQITVDTANTLPNLEHDNTDDMSPECLSEDSHSVPCSISIKFHDETIADLYKSKFLKFISSFTGLCVHDDGIVIQVFRDKNVCNNEEGTTPCAAKKRKKHSKVKKELFVVDSTPSDATETDLRYITKFTIGNENAAAANAVQNSRGSCFNCGQAHALKDCTEPKDYAKIAAARQKFRTQTKSSRYHLEDQRFSHLQAGKISSELKRALGLEKNEAPHYVYLMRKLGYPPGWLEEAKLVHSNLDMFDIDGKHVKSGAPNKPGLDENKIVDYPGFNVPFHKGVKDDYRGYKVPPYSDNFSKEAMICFFQKQATEEEDNLETCQMDVEHPIEVSDLSQAKRKKFDIEQSVERDSPSLIDLEQQKLQLLEELNEEPKEEIKDAELEKDFLAIKTSCFGTPLLKSSSPYSTLPDPDNFSKDVSPVINFENLPNSTGKYEQLTDVLQKVRNTLKNVNNCST